MPAVKPENGSVRYPDGDVDGGCPLPRWYQIPSFMVPLAMLLAMLALLAWLFWKFA